MRQTRIAPPGPVTRLYRIHGVLRLLLWTALAITAAFMLFIWQDTFAPAVALLVLYCLLVLVSTIVHRARLATRRRAAATASETDAEEVLVPARDLPTEEEILAVEERTGLRIGLEIVGGLVLLAIVLASVFFGWRLVALATLVIFATLMFVGAPFWLAIVTEQIEAKHERMTGQTRSIH